MRNRTTQLSSATYVVLALALTFWALNTPTHAQPTSFGEAPQLAQQVEAGELPPVEERLPANPMVIEPVERIGKYGGDWRMAMVGGSDGGSIRITVAYENLVRWTPDYESVIPNIAESVEVNEDATAYTFHLREGMKWSDGHPYTADDIMFWYEDILLNQELTPTVPSWLMAGGEPVVVEKVDDYTVVFRFASPYGLFLQRMALVEGIYPSFQPRHYFEQFHPTYNPENIDQLVQEAGVADWVALFQQKGGGPVDDNRFMNVELPVIYPWVITRPLGDTTRVVVERNPYYWKVDPEGNQLPYIDRVIFEQLNDQEVAILRALGGEIDMQERHLASPIHKPLIVDNMEQGDYRLFTSIPTTVNTMTINLNLNHPDPVKREIYQNKDFRIGLSHAINRQEIIDLVHIGEGEPHQAAPRPDSAFYHEQLAKQYTEYDVDLANEYLDRAGYSERDGQGFRLGPDGERIVIFVEQDAADVPLVDMMEVVQGYWREVGIDVQPRPADRSLWETRVRQRNIDYDAVAHRFGGGSGQEVIIDPRYWMPFDNNSVYARAWSIWRTNPSGEGALVQPEEPPAAAQRQMELYSQLEATGDPERQAELMREILDIAVEEFYTMGISTEGDRFGIVKNDFRNVPDTMFFSYRWPAPGPTNPEQYFWDR